MSKIIHLSCRGVHKSYQMGKTDLRVLRGVDVDVYEGETLSITGASGAGKSTLLHVIGALDRPQQGRVHFRGEDVYAASRNWRSLLRARQLGFVFQSYHLLPELTVLENVMLPIMAASRKTSRAVCRAKASGLLDAVGLGERLTHRPMELSGGEQQRVALARALINDPEVVLADEPTGNLDSRTGQTVLDYMFKLTRDRGLTLVMVTHNQELAGLCSRHIVLEDGQLAR